MNLNLLIVEDSISYSIELEQQAIEIGYNVIAVVDNSADALDIIYSESPDIIMMDIDIKGRLSGLEIAKKIHHLNIPILYITSFGDEETYQQALESNLLGYLVKPIDKLTLATTLKLLIKRSLNKESNNNEPQLYQNNGDNHIFFMKNDVYQKVKINDITFIKSENNYCQINLKDNRSYLVRIKLNEAYDLLKDQKFIQCHRQYIVNQMKIKSLNTIMKTIEVGSQSVPYSRSKKDEIMSIGIFLK